MSDAGFFANPGIHEMMTLGIFTILVCQKIVTLYHGTFRRQFMSEFPIFDANAPISEGVTLSRGTVFPENQGVCGPPEL